MWNTLCSTAALSALTLASSAPAAVIFNDTFDSGTGTWYASRTSSTVANSSGALAFTTNSASSDHRILGKGFTPQTLVNDGDVLRLTFDFKHTQNSTLTLYRVGLFNIANTPAANDWNNSPANVGATSLWGSAYSGYYSFLRDNATINEARSDTRTGLQYNAGGVAPTLGVGPTISSGSSPASYNIATDNSVTYQVLFEVTRVSATSTTTLMTMTDGVNSVSLSGSDTSGLYSTFNSVFIQSTSGTASTTTTLDNIQLEYFPVPEPASLALLGLGALTVFRRSRHG